MLEAVASASAKDDNVGCAPSARLPSIEELGQEWLPMETFTFKDEQPPFKEDPLLSDGDSPPASSSSRHVNSGPFDARLTNLGDVAIRILV